MDYYSTSLQHLLAELERIDLLIQVQVSRARQVQSIDGEFQGFYISEQEIEALLARPIGLPYWATTPSLLSLAEVQAALQQLTDLIDQHKAESARQNILLRLDMLTARFQLAPFDIDILLICLAPEIDLRYERLYAYLQDDVNKKQPSVDLVLNLLSPTLDAKLAARQHFSPTAPLFKHGLISLFGDPSHPQPSLLSQFLKVDERIVSYLLGSDEVDRRLQPFVEPVTALVQWHDLSLPTGVKERLLRLTAKNEMAAGGVFYFQGPYGVGKETVAAAVCQTLGMGLLTVNGERLLNTQEIDFDQALRLIMREVQLQGAALYWEGFDALLDEARRFKREALLKALEVPYGLTFLAGNMPWEPVDALHRQMFVRVELSGPGYAERQQLWTTALNGHLQTADDLDLPALAGKFRFTPGQIRDAAATAANLARWRDPEMVQVTMTDLYAACRLQSNHKLGTLAQKITPHYHWDDIVLPADRLAQLREICNVVKYRAQVYDAWGFDRKLALGKGLNALFVGPSGTGKTMAAEIIAGELALDLYKIDLSGVVSKYIGETEKNLSRIFAEAETSNAILFFDEADALFGKRSEVRDAHDRYANVEISYLLQRMEEYEGVVILTTNLRKNMDDAFVRRMHFAVEFPFPAESDRQRIWRQIWPEETPRTPDLDLVFMARQFEITGGNIRNIALAAAFLAAEDGGMVTMGHLIRATQREYQKMGKIVAEDEFGAYGRYARRR